MRNLLEMMFDKSLVTDINVDQLSIVGYEKEKQQSK